MQFGKVLHPELVDFTLPKDHSDTLNTFVKKGRKSGQPNVYIGAARWSRADMKGFYPRGTKDDLAYYSRQFNAIEMNSTFYRIFSPEQFAKWRDRTPDDFKFFPKIPQEISHFKQLNNFQEPTDRFILAASELGDKLGTVFLQLKEQFAPNRFQLLQNFVEDWPTDLPLTVEVRHVDWFEDATVANELHNLLSARNTQFTLVDTPGRRDMLHMRLPNPSPFVRWVAAYHEVDYPRLDEWVERIAAWSEQGMEELHFFVHQKLEVDAPLLSAYFIERLNARMGWNLKVPNSPEGETPTLFD
ncbi:MAG: DUF72 domain-containing protein [bacterium]|nr:DUF72 domain-containing protein [bacterium]